MTVFREDAPSPTVSPKRGGLKLPCQIGWPAELWPNDPCTLACTGPIPASNVPVRNCFERSFAQLALVRKKLSPAPAPPPAAKLLLPPGREASVPGTPEKPPAVANSPMLTCQPLTKIPKPSSDVPAVPAPAPPSAEPPRVTPIPHRPGGSIRFTGSS